MVNTENNLNSSNEWSDFWHYKKGINIFPLDNDKKTYENWTQYQLEAISDKKHEEWKIKNRYIKGIILMPGKVYRGEYKGIYFVGIDFDKELGIKEFCNLNTGNTSIDELKQKFIVESHNGDSNSFHVYFYSEIPFTDKSADSVLGIEIKSNGKGLMCATPSYHSETDSRWQIKGTDSPIVLKSEEALRLMFLINDICDKHGISYLDKKEGSNSSSNPEIRKMIDTLKINPNVIIQEGERHNTLLSIANSLLFKHWSNEPANEPANEENSRIIENLMKFFYEINYKLCKPEPIPEKELKNIWINSIDYVQRNRNQKNSSSKEKNKTKTETEKKFIETATEDLIKKYNFLTIEESKDILFYESGVYKKGGDIIIEKELELMFGYSLRASHIADIVGHIRRRTYIKSNDFDKDLNIINLKNGLYNIESEKLEPHSPNYHSLNQKPITFDPTAKTKLFGSFLQQVLYPTDIRTTIEILAYTFIRENPYELFFILFGIGANGKNVYTGMLAHLHGFENVSNISLKSIVESRFAIAGLENKDVNVDTELLQDIISDTSTLKRLTGKQPISIERKGKDAYDVKLHAKLFFNANTIPLIKDTSDARFRREVIISFPNQFQEGMNADPKLLDKLTTESEKSGIFNILMKALKTIQKNDNIYLDQKTIQERRRKHELVSDPIGSFLKDAVADDSVYDDYTIKDNFYNAYTNYCKYHRLPFESEENFGKILKQKHRYQDSRKTINKTRKKVWIGVRLVKWTNADLKQQLIITKA